MNEHSFQMWWIRKIIYDSDKKIEKTDLLINTPPAYYHYYYYYYYLLFIINVTWWLTNLFMISSNYLNTRIYISNVLLIFQMKKQVDFKLNWKFRRNIYIRFSNQSNKSVKLKFVLCSHFYFTDFILNPSGCWVSQKSSGKKKEFDPFLLIYSFMN